MRAVWNATASALLAAAVSLACMAGAVGTGTPRKGTAPLDGVTVAASCDGRPRQVQVSQAALSDVDVLKGMTMGQASRRLSERHPSWRVEWWLADQLADDGKTQYARTLTASDVSVDTKSDPLRVVHAALEVQPDGDSWIVTARVTVGNRATGAKRETEWQRRKARAACDDYMQERYPWGVRADGTANVTGNPSDGWLVSGRMDVTNQYNATARNRPYECRCDAGFKVTAFTAPGNWEEDTAR